MYCIVSADIFFPNPHSEILVCQDVRLDLVSFLYEALDLSIPGLEAMQSLNLSLGFV
jgi:hypothetical protein